MRLLLKFTKIILLISLSVWLTACGGSGNSGGSNGDTSGNDVFPESEAMTLILEGGIIMELPAGALSGPIQITAKSLDPTETQQIIDGSGIRKRLFMAGACFTPSGYRFSKPVTVTLPANALLPDTEVPIHFKYDKERHAYYPTDTQVTVTPVDGTITFTLNEFSDHVIAGVADVVTQKCIENGEQPCRCGEFTVVTENSDLLYTSPDGVCNVSAETGSITYNQCVPIVTESWDFVEHTSGCVPKMILSPKRTAIATGESTPVTATITYGRDPLPGQQITLVGNGLLEAQPSLITTDANGTTQTTASAGTREGVGIVSAAAIVTYEPVAINVNGQPEPGIPRQKTLLAKAAIAIDGPLSLEVSILPGIYGNYLIVGEETQVSVAILEPNTTTGGIDFVPSTDVILNESGGTLASHTVRTSSLSEITVPFTAPNTPGSIIITGDATVETLNEIAEPVDITVTGSDVIDVLERPVETWTGSLSLSYFFGPGIDPQQPSHVPWGISAYISIDFLLYFDPLLGNPSFQHSNVTGLVKASTLTVVPRDSVLVDGDWTYRHYWTGVDHYPFQPTLVGLAPISNAGKEMYLRFLHPNGYKAPLADGTLWLSQASMGTVWLTDKLQDWAIQWSDDVDVQPEPIWHHEPIYINLTGKETASINGRCELDPAFVCTYTLTMTRESVGIP